MTNTYYPSGAVINGTSGTFSGAISAGSGSISGTFITGTDYFTPLTGTSITLVNNFSNINPAGTIATLTIVLPTSPVNNQVCGFVSSQIVTTLTVTGTTLVTAPTTLAIGTVYKYRYNSTTSSWWPA